jgi:hypothetical protein
VSDKPETIFIYDERESVWLSWLRDAFSFGCLLGTALALNILMPPSGWLNAAIAICWFLWLVEKGLRRRMRKTPAEAIAWLRETFPEQSA